MIAHRSLRSRPIRPCVAGCLFLVLSAMPTLSHAELQPTERATAEALFQHGVQLMAEQKYAEACQKFEGALAIERGLGTLLRLADCYDRAGQTASAWALFQDLASLAQATADDVRAQIATQRSTDLEQRLSLLKLEFAGGSKPDGARIEFGGAQIPAATSETPVPVNPGRRRIVVSAPGHEQWSSWVEIKPGPSLRALVIPPLRETPVPAAPLPSRLKHSPLPQPAEQNQADSENGSTQRTWGILTTVVGVAGLSTAGFLGYRAAKLNDESLNECRPEDSSACTPEGVRTRDEARDYANGANIAGALGGAALLGGLALLIWGPDETDSQGELGARLVPSVAPQGAQLRWKGSF